MGCILIQEKILPELLVSFLHHQYLLRQIILTKVKKRKVKLKEETFILHRQGGKEERERQQRGEKNCSQENNKREVVHYNFGALYHRN